MILEDTISREKNWKEKQEKLLIQMKQTNAPRELIEQQELRVSMTRAEYSAYLEESTKQFDIEKAEYYKNNPMRKDVYDALYAKTEILQYERVAVSSAVRFLMLLDPESMMSERDYYYGVYDDIINHCWELYQEEYSEEYERDTASLH
jgi:hypothetical protein